MAKEGGQREKKKLTCSLTLTHSHQTHTHIFILLVFGAPFPISQKKTNEKKQNKTCLPKGGGKG
jgi:hypothetical protein